MGFLEEKLEAMSDEPKKAEEPEPEEVTVKMAVDKYIAALKSCGLKPTTVGYIPITDDERRMVIANGFAFMEMCNRLNSSKVMWWSPDEKPYGDDTGAVSFQFCTDDGDIFEYAIDQDTDLEALYKMLE